MLGEVVKDVVARFLAIEGKGVARMKALSEAFSGGHLLVYSTDAEFQRGLALAGRLLMRKTRRGPPDSEHLRRDLGLLPIDRPWGPWDFL